MGAGFVRFYLTYWIVDMAIGVFLCLVGFSTPLVYVRLTLSPLSAAESYGFLLATVVFVFYLWPTRPGGRLYLFPIYQLLTAIVMNVVFTLNARSIATSAYNVQAAYLEAMQRPSYLGAALACSLLGIALWFWARPSPTAGPGALSPAPGTPEALKNLREARQLAMQSRK